MKIWCPKDSRLLGAYMLCNLFDRSFLHYLVLSECLTRRYIFLPLPDQVAESKSCPVMKVEDGDSDKEPRIELSSSPTYSEVSISRWVLDNGHPDSLTVGDALKAVKGWAFSCYRKERSLLLTTFYSWNITTCNFTVIMIKDGFGPWTPPIWFLKKNSASSCNSLHFINPWGYRRHFRNMIAFHFQACVAFTGQHYNNMWFISYLISISYRLHHGNVNYCGN